LYGPDYYPGNFNDGPLPIASIKAKGAGFVILKYSEGTSYGNWAPQQGPRVRAAGMVLAGYHMLDGPGAGGKAQAQYFLGKYAPQPGDMVPIVDYESIGEQGVDITLYKNELVAFIDEVHAQGFECMLYGHSTVKASFTDWRQSHADYWWVPGSQAWSDCGPVGPDLWQYQPYTLPAGFPHNFRGDGQREDASKVLTQLPIVGGNDDMASEDIRKGSQAFRAGQPLPAGSNADFTFGYNLEKRIDAASKSPAPGQPAPHTHDVTGKAN